MKRSLLLAVVVALALAGPAPAKWIDRVTITGPGVERPIVTGGEFLFDSSGFYAATFGPSTDLLPAAPIKRLGPRYTVLYSLPGPERVRVRQDLYPYAAGGPITYTPPGQPLYDGQRTRGGWYAGGRDLKDALASIGLPRAAPAPRDRDRQLWVLAPTGALVLGALLLVARLSIVTAPVRLSGWHLVPRRPRGPSGRADYESTFSVRVGARPARRSARCRPASSGGGMWHR